MNDKAAYNGYPEPQSARKLRSLAGHPFHAIDRVRLDEADQRLIELVRERRRMQENYSRSDDSSPNVDFRQQWRHAEKAQTQMHAFQNPVTKPTGDQTPIAPVCRSRTSPLKRFSRSNRATEVKDSLEHANFYLRHLTHLFQRLACIL